jgi:hypothetical protein
VSSLLVLNLIIVLLAFTDPASTVVAPTTIAPTAIVLLDGLSDANAEGEEDDGVNVGHNDAGCVELKGDGHNSGQGGPEQH